MVKKKEVGAPKTQAKQPAYYERYKCFSIVRNPKTDNRTMLAIGNRLLPTHYVSEDEAKQAIDNRDWEVLLDAFIIVAQYVDDMRKKEQQEQEQKFEEGKE